MKNRLTLCISALLIVTVATSFAPQPSAFNIRRLRWLKGAWLQPTERGSSLEVWKVLNDSTLAGTSYQIRGKDTVLKENVSLEQRAGNLYYVATPLGQNDDEPVSFKCIRLSDRKADFENPEHDFPQKITYELIRQDSLVASISGMIKGNGRVVTFPMKRLR